MEQTGKSWESLPNIAGKATQNAQQRLPEARPEYMEIANNKLQLFYCRAKKIQKYPGHFFTAKLYFLFLFRGDGSGPVSSGSDRLAS